jgi:hypothetical protein
MLNGAAANSEALSEPRLRRALASPTSLSTCAQSVRCISCPSHNAQSVFTTIHTFRPGRYARNLACLLARSTATSCAFPPSPSRPITYNHP